MHAEHEYGSIREKRGLGLGLTRWFPLLFLTQASDVLMQALGPAVGAEASLSSRSKLNVLLEVDSLYFQVYMYIYI